MRCFWKGSLILVVAAALPSMAWAEQVFLVELTPLNDSGVTGDGRLTLDGDLLTVELNATGLEPNQVHPQHIHGLLADGEDDNGVGDDDNGEGVAEGTPINSVVPTLDQDTDGDGFIEVAEGIPAYGPVILPLTSPPGSEVFPTAPEDGTLNFTETYDLSEDDLFADTFDRDDLLPLDLRTVVLHGMSVDVGVGGGTTGEVNGAGGYLPSLPVAAGEITVVPLPAAVWPGLVILGALVLRRRRVASAM